MHIGEQRGSAVDQYALADFIHCANAKEEHQHDKETFSDDPYSSTHLSFYSEPIAFRHRDTRLSSTRIGPSSVEIPPLGGVRVKS